MSSIPPSKPPSRRDSAAVAPASEAPMITMCRSLIQSLTDMQSHRHYRQRTSAVRQGDACKASLRSYREHHVCQAAPRDRSVEIDDLAQAWADPVGPLGAGEMGRIASTLLGPSANLTHHAGPAWPNTYNARPCLKARPARRATSTSTATARKPLAPPTAQATRTPKCSAMVPTRSDPKGV